MNREYVDEVYAAQAEACQLITDLDLFTLLSHAGKPELIGSSVSGLMVWRDLDFNVLCSHLTPDQLFKTVQPLLVDPRVNRFNYTNETGRAAPAELHGDERYYCVVYYETEAGNEWKIDLSFWLSDATRNQLPYLEYLSRQLTDETRLAILLEGAPFVNKRYASTGSITSIGTRPHCLFSAGRSFSAGGVCCCPIHLHTNTLVSPISD